MNYEIPKKYRKELNRKLTAASKLPNGPYFSFIQKQSLVDEANRVCGSGAVSAILHQQFGNKIGSVLFELIGIGAAHWEELDTDYIDQA